jgi:hypothetical protein
MTLDDFVSIPSKVAQWAFISGTMEILSTIGLTCTDEITVTTVQKTLIAAAESGRLARTLPFTTALVKTFSEFNCELDNSNLKPAADDVLKLFPKDRWKAGAKRPVS